MRNGVDVTDPILKSGSGNTTQAASYIPGVAEKRNGISTWLHGATSNFAAESDATQALAATIDQDAFGNTVLSSGSWRGKTAHAGQYGIEQEDGVSLIGARWYDQEVGRFLTRDTAYDGSNWYAYCANNPTSFVDEDGLGFRSAVAPPDLRSTPSGPPRSAPVHRPAPAPEKGSKVPAAGDNNGGGGLGVLGVLSRLGLIVGLILLPANLGDHTELDAERELAKTLQDRLNASKGGRDKGRGDDPLYSKSTEELEKIYDDPATPIVVKKKIEAILKSRGDRNKAKRSGQGGKGLNKKKKKRSVTDEHHP